ncbi:phosphatase 2C-like domain-containing protein [Tribonema minus]|uniref:Phosphatase 2C-like domain-containing protein n=1 Tax=Tribonema minus TaxID=303371 RepID=A0A835Z4T9_9STRA|nr:phosphatase 2C-like domain-containing protein [Tribonema minus]
MFAKRVLASWHESGAAEEDHFRLPFGEQGVTCAPTPDDSRAELPYRAPPVPIVYAKFTSIGNRSYQEDRLVTVQDLNQFIPPEVEADRTIRRSFYAVFDGPLVCTARRTYVTLGSQSPCGAAVTGAADGGDKCSQWLSENFHMALASHPLVGTDIKAALQQLWPTLDDKFYEYLETIQHRAAQQRPSMSQSTFNPEDPGVMAAAGPAGEGDWSFPRDGSTATVCVVEGNRAILANCGDSAAALVRRVGMRLVCEPLSENHGTLNSAETARIRSVGGELQVRGRARRVRAPPLCCVPWKSAPRKPRVYPGGLLVTRAYGDFYAKRAPLGGLPGALICGHGRLSRVELDGFGTDGGGGAGVVILASDGVWDAVPVWRMAAALERLVLEDIADEDEGDTGAGGEGGGGGGSLGASRHAGEDPVLLRTCKSLVMRAAEDACWGHPPHADNVSAILLQYGDGIGEIEEGGYVPAGVVVRPAVPPAASISKVDEEQWLFVQHRLGLQTLPVPFPQYKLHQQPMEEPAFVWTSQDDSQQSAEYVGHIQSALGSLVGSPEQSSRPPSEVHNVHKSRVFSP